MGYSSNDPRNYIALARQSAADTEASTGFKFIKYQGDSGFSPDITSETIFEGGDGQDPGLVYKSKVKPDGQIVGYVRPDMFTTLSAWAMGSAAAVGTSAGVGTSVFVPNATVPFLTIEQAWGGGNQIDRVSNAILTGWQLEGEAGMPWQLTTPFVAGGTPYWRDGAASALSATFESGDPAMYAGGAYLINGASTLDITRFNVNFTRNVDDDLHTTEVFRRKVVPLSRSVELTFQLIWQDQTIYKQIQSGDTSGTVMARHLATGAFHAERQLTASQLMAVDIPNLRYTGVEVNRLQPDGQTVVLDVSAVGVKAGTGIMQVRSVHSGVGASALLG